MTDPNAIRQAVADAYLQAQGLAGQIVPGVHSSDEMMGTLEDYRVDASLQLFEYYRSGFEALAVLENVLESAGRSWESVESFLEFACGFGRFTRHLVRKLPADRVWSSDILKDGVAFVRETHRVHGFDSSTEPGDCELPRAFDVIWVGSLFSHLPRARFSEWLKRLFDALTPNGLLVFTTHGPDVVADVPKDSAGFTFVPQSESLSLEKSEYGATFVEPRVVHELAAALGIEHLQHLEREIWWIQDVWVASRGAIPELKGWRAVPLIKGTFDHIRFDLAGNGWLGGWAVVPESASPIRGIEVVVDGAASFPAELSGARQGDEVEKIRPGASHVGWVVHGSAAALPPGQHVAAAIATTVSGNRICFDVRPFEFTPGEAWEWQAS